MSLKSDYVALERIRSVGERVQHVFLWVQKMADMLAALLIASLFNLSFLHNLKPDDNCILNKQVNICWLAEYNFIIKADGKQSFYI